MNTGEATVAAPVISGWLAGLGLAEFVSIDVETTGLDPEQDGLIEIAAVRFRGGVPVEEYSSLVSYPGNIPRFITDLTGIADPDLIGAPPFKEIARDYLRFLGEAPLVGQNVDFDLGFLRSHLDRVKSLAGDRTSSLNRVPLVDTALIGRVFWPEQTGFSLGSQARRFGVPLARAHRAADDARATGMVLVRMVEELPNRVWRDLAEILYTLIGTTTHRCRPFFASLLRLADSIAPPHREPVIPTEEEPECVAVTETVADLLGEGGLFETRFSHFRSRSEQVEMAESVERCFENQSIIVVEAPTGVGKSLAYLAPAIRWALPPTNESRQVIVSSHTKTLQEQLFRKDTAELRKVLPDRFHASVLKGRANYLCKRRLHVLIAEAADRLSELDRVSIMPLVRWSELTASGDINEIGGFRPRRHPHLWPQIASDSATCGGTNCSAAKGDFYRIAADRANRAQVVFVNHALLMSDPARFLPGNGKQRSLVIDEAHQLENAVVAALTAELSPTAIRNVLVRLVEERGSRGLIGRILKGAPKGTTEWSGLLEQVRSLYASSRQAFTLLAEQLLVAQGESRRSLKQRYGVGDPLSADVAHFLTPLTLDWRELEIQLARLIAAASDWTGEQRPRAELIQELKSVAEQAAELGAQLVDVVSGDRPDYVRWVECGRGRGGPWCSVYDAPIEVSTHLAKHVWPNCGGTLFTSATLSVGQNIEFFKRAVGLSLLDGRQVESLSLPSPFRLDEQMRIFVPTYLPAPREAARHLEAVTQLVTKVIAKFPRGTLILCTSNDAVERITESMSPVIRASGRALLSQSAGSSPAELVDEFRALGNAIMIGAASFWEGIDVVGDALQLLIVAKLPFDVPSDPWIAARTEQLQREGRDPFYDYSIPVATLRLKQGLGRLIRHTGDRGAAIVADPRVMTARYGRQIRSSIAPDMRSVGGELELLAAVHDFFAEPAS
ncbi:DEAD/DEAH box helicase [candidate division KSB1 bacterium]|nr:DEAD/DEAH box helicase [candidate division KSB1 bacterium]